MPSAATQDRDATVRGFRARVKQVFRVGDSNAALAPSKRWSLGNIFHRERSSRDTSSPKRASFRQSLKLFLRGPGSNVSGSSCGSEESLNIPGRDHSPVIPATVVNPRIRPHEVSTAREFDRVVPNAPEAPQTSPKIDIPTHPGATPFSANESERNTSASTNATVETTATSITWETLGTSSTTMEPVFPGISADHLTTSVSATAENFNISPASIAKMPARKLSHAPQIPESPILRRQPSLLAEYNAIVDSMFKAFMLGDDLDNKDIQGNKGVPCADGEIFEPLLDPAGSNKKTIDQVCSLHESSSAVFGLSNEEGLDRFGSCSLEIGSNHNFSVETPEYQNHIANMDPFRTGEMPTSTSSVYSQDEWIDMDDEEHEDQVVLHTGYVLQLQTIPEHDEDGDADNDQNADYLVRQDDDHDSDSSSEDDYTWNTETEDVPAILEASFQAWSTFVDQLAQSLYSNDSERDTTEVGTMELDIGYDSDSETFWDFENVDLDDSESVVIDPHIIYNMSWSQHSFIDDRGFLDTYANARLRHDHSGLLQRCRWHLFARRSILDYGLGPEIMVTDPDGNTFYPDDLMYYVESPSSDEWSSG
ncbi:hypothetical protein B0T16DRAFT_502666 [Cercophora newfieldiana]|uniref:Uncharacterized protein n=1 Tax=Cercophora newfieldiana TaxID=92897 RepID=A0AA39YSH8_9PEZI|nr:hypothetical protein B0T16DRAFT_502666 [Cercophora newfieldiana]